MAVAITPNIAMFDGPAIAIAAGVWRSAGLVEIPTSAEVRDSQVGGQDSAKTARLFGAVETRIADPPPPV